MMDAVVIFAPETVGLIPRGTPVVFAGKADPWIDAVNDRNRRLAALTANRALQPDSLNAYGYASAPVALAGAGSGARPSEIDALDVGPIVDAACARGVDRRVGKSQEQKIRTYASGLVRFIALAPGPKSDYLTDLAWRDSPERRPRRLPGLPALKAKFVPQPTPADRDVRALRGASRTGSERGLMDLLHGAGLRRAEARNATVKDGLGLKADLEAGRKPSLQVRGKGDKTREVPVSAAVAARLGTLAEARVRCGAREDATLITNASGGALSLGGVNDVVRRLCKRARIAHLTPHALRRKFARDWAEQYGIDGRLPPKQLQVLAAILGHASTATLRHYLTSEREDGSARRAGG
jgi:integrase